MTITTGLRSLIRRRGPGCAEPEHLRIVHQLSLSRPRAELMRHTTIA